MSCIRISTRAGKNRTPASPCSFSYLLCTPMRRSEVQRTSFCMHLVKAWVSCAGCVQLSRLAMRQHGGASDCSCRSGTCQREPRTSRLQQLMLGASEAGALTSISWELCMFAGTGSISAGVSCPSHVPVEHTGARPYTTVSAVSMKEQLQMHSIVPGASSQRAAGA